MATLTLLPTNSTNTVVFTAKVSGNAVSASSILLDFKDTSGNAFIASRNISGDYLSASTKYQTTLTTSECSGRGPWFLTYTWLWGGLTRQDIEEVHLVERDLKYASYADVVNRDPQRLGPQATTSGSAINIDMLYRYCLETESEVDGALNTARYSLPVTDDDALEYLRLAASYGAASKTLNAWFPTRVGEYGFNGFKFERQFEQMMGNITSGNVQFSNAAQSDLMLPTSLTTQNTIESLDEDEIWFKRDGEF